jgi:hypothetical protein
MAAVAIGGTGSWVLAPAGAQSPGRSARVADGEPGAPLDPKDPKQLEASLAEIPRDVLLPTKFAQIAPSDDQLTKLQKQRYEAARRECLDRLNAFAAGTTQGTIDLMIASVRDRLLPAEMALTAGRLSDKEAAYNRALIILGWVDRVNEIRFDAGRIPAQDREQSRFERLSLEIKLLEIKAAGNVQQGR